MKVDFNAFKEQMNQNSKSNFNQNGDTPQVRFFSLKNDKDQAIVRFMVDSEEDVEIVAGHRYNYNGRQRLINCLREPKEGSEKCPLCEAGEKVVYRAFIKLLEYTRDDNGNIVAIPKVWERPASYMNTIINLLNEYGPLSDSVFKITRNGETGSTSTTYDVVYGLPTVYKPDIYVKEEGLFGNYEVIGNTVLNLGFNKMRALVSGEEGNEREEGVAPASRPAFQTSNVAQETPRREFSTPAPEQSTMRPRRFY